MKTVTTMVAFLALSGFSHAQNVEESEEGVAGEAPVDELGALRAELAKVTASTEASEAARAKAESLLDAANILGDGRNPAVKRMEAAMKLGSLSDDRAVGFLWMGVRDEDAAVRTHVYGAATFYPGEATTSLGRLGVLTEEGEAFEAAAALLVAQSTPEAAEVLWEVAGSKTVSAEARKGALGALERGYPELLAERGQPETVSGKVGEYAMMVANGAAGGVSLASIGMYGQDDAAIGIGAVGGTAIGAAGSLLYTRIQPVSDGQGVAYASSTGWGLLGGHYLGEILFPNAEVHGHVAWDDDEQHDILREEQEALQRWRGAVRTLGVLGGAGLGARLLDKNVALEDVMEINVGGYLGSQLGLGLVDLLNQRPDVYNDYGCVNYYYDDDYGYYNDCDEVVTQQDVGDWDLKAHRLRSAGILLGSAAGASAGYLLSDDWKPTEEDAYFAMITGAAGGLVGYGLPVAITDDDVDGGVRVGIHMGLVGGMAYSHFRPVSIDQSKSALWHTGMGNVLGGSAALFAGVDSDAALQRWLVPSGLAGLAYGVWLGEDAEITRNDMGLVGVGTVLGLWNAAGIAFVLDENGWLTDDQAGAITLLGLGASGIASAYASKETELDFAYSNFVGTATAWGLFYAGSSGVAFDLDLSDAQYVTGLLVASDLAALGAGYAASRFGFFDAKDTAFANLGGLTGATLASLGAFMATDDPESVALGAMVGATLGIVGGAAATPAIKKRLGKAEVSKLDLPDLPGDWALSLTPSVMENGEMGAYVGLRASGF